MMESSSSGYRRMGARSGPSRNLFFFGILFNLVVIFSVFFLYLSASSDVNTLRDQLNAGRSTEERLKNELLALNTRVESIQRQSEECTKKVETGKEDLTLCKNGKSSLETQITKLEGDLKVEKESKSDSEQTSQQKIKAMETVGVGQQAIITSLNATVEALRRDLILKDEIITKLQAGKETTSTSTTTTSLPVVNKVANAPPLNNQDPIEERIKNAQPGDRIKMEENNEKKEKDDSLLKVAIQQDSKTALDSPVAKASNIII